MEVRLYQKQNRTRRVAVTVGVPPATGRAGVPPATGFSLSFLLLVYSVWLTLPAPAQAQDVADMAEDVATETGDLDDGDITEGDLEDDASVLIRLIGESCTDDLQCSAELMCVQAPDEPAFVDGYCGRVGCLFSNQCGTGLCGAVFGRRYCLQKCTTVVDCREGYLCLPLSADTAACVPRCFDTEHCRDPALACDMDSGMCVDAPDVVPEDMGAPDTGVEMDTGTPDPQDTGTPTEDAAVDTEPPSDLGTGEGTGAVEDDHVSQFEGSCSCQQPAGSPAWLGALILSLVAVLMLRRRRA